MSICRGFNTTKLNKEDDYQEWLSKHWGEKLVTFSSILGEGPPPPSPFPKTSREMSEDSRFYEKLP